MPPGGVLTRSFGKRAAEGHFRPRHHPTMYAPTNDQTKCSPIQEYDIKVRAM